ncbi:MAG: hypothetical protein JJE50_04965, partial [Actinomycetales bacterium]|nr:hypothetical protein [Actinomycetales bacterium]
TVPTATDTSSVVAQGVGLVPPSYDRYGWVWTANAANSGALIAGAVDHEQVAVAAQVLAHTQVKAVRVSRDGTRVAVIFVAEGVVEVQVAAIGRDADGVPVQLGAPLAIAETLLTASALAWVDEQTIAVLGVSGTANTVHLVTVGGPSIALPSVADATSIASGRGDRELYVATTEGALYARSGNGWRRVAEGVADPAFPG